MSEINEPLYQKIYNHIINQMKTGSLVQGDKIPSEKELAEEFGVSRITSKKALEMLADNGLIRRMPGKGSFVIGENEQQESRVPLQEKSKESSYLVGVVISDFSESYGSGLISGIEKEASDNDYFIIPRRSYGKQDMEERAIEALIDIGVDGIIVMPVHGEYYSPKILRLILDGFPITVIDRRLKGIPAPFVGSDNIDAAKKATDYLLKLGHKDICFISPPPTNTSAIEERVDGFVKSHAANGIAIDETIWITDIICTMPGKNTIENIKADIERIKKHIKSNPQITCFFAVEYNIAVLVNEAIKELGMNVPNDISIVCFDGPGSFTEEYFFTHIRQREELMGAAAFKLIQNQIEGISSDAKEIFMDTDLIIGTSTKDINCG